MLSEERRKQLDGIVQQMATNKEPSSNIQAVVNDFKSKYGGGVSQPIKSGAEQSAEQFKPMFPAEQNEGSLEATAKVVGNLPGSAIRFGVDTAKGLVSMLNPVNIIKNVAAIPGEVKSLVQESGGFGSAAKNFGIATPDIAKQLLPTFAQKLIEGNIDEARFAIENDPVGQIAPLLLLTREIAHRAGKGAQFDKLMEHTASPVTKPGAMVVEAGKTKLHDIAAQIEKSNLRLTPTQKTNLTKKLPDITSYLAKKKIIGSAQTKFEKLDDLYEQTETQLSNFLSKELKGRTIDRDILIKQIRAVKKQFANERDALAINKQIENMVKTLEAKYPKNIPAAKLNELKRSTFKTAYNNAGVKVLDEVEFAMGDKLKEAVEVIAKGITQEKKINGMSLGEFNKEYGTLIQARKLVKQAIGRNELGALNRLFAGIAGFGLGSVFGPLGQALGVFGGEYFAKTIAGTGAKSLVGAGLQKLSETQLPKMNLPTLKR